MFTAVVRITGAGRLEDFRERLRWLMVRDVDAEEMPSADRIYTVQVIWDETMADSAARWLAAHPDGHLILLAGNGHCHDSAVIGRLKRRGVAEAISIRSVIDDGEGSVADVLAKPINDLVVVLQMPAGVERAAPAPATK